MSAPGHRRRQVLAIAAIALVSLNLRPAANALGAVIPEVRSDLGLSATAAGVLNALPGLCFVIFGLIAPAIAARTGAQPTVVIALVAMTAGQLLRVALPGTAAVFGGSVLALAGMALGNVLLPGLVRSLFPRHVPAVTALYTTCLLAGATAASGLTVPIADSLDGGWRTGVGSWTVVTGLALIPWIAMLVTPRAGSKRRSASTIRLHTLVRNPVAWSMALFFGMNAMQAYVLTGWLSQILVDAGVNLGRATAAVAVFVGTGLPMAAIVPTLARRQSRLPGLVVALGLSYIAGYAGLMLIPAEGFWVWAVLIGAGAGAFPLALMMVTIRARTLDGLTALSAFAQSSGYVLATLGPFVFGLLHDLTGGWTVPILMMIAVSVAMVTFGLLAARPRVVEDHLPVPTPDR